MYLLDVLHAPLCKLDARVDRASDLISYTNGASDPGLMIYAQRRSEEGSVSNLLFRKPMWGRLFAAPVGFSAVFY